MMTNLRTAAPTYNEFTMMAKSTYETTQPGSVNETLKKVTDNLFYTKARESAAPSGPLPTPPEGRGGLLNISG